MSDADKVTAILNSIQADATLLVLLRALISKNVPNVPSAQLDAICMVLGIATS